MPPTTINLNDSTPAAPAGRANVKWQHDVLNPENVSAFMDVATGSAAGAIILTGDFGGTATAPLVISTHLSIPLPTVQGGTGANTFPANAFLAGPVSGAAAAPTVRVLSPLDFQNAVFGASGPSHSSGTVPDPGPVAGVTRYLREDATWQIGIGTPPGGSVNDVQIASVSGFYGDSGFTYVPGTPIGAITMVATATLTNTTTATGVNLGASAPPLGFLGNGWTGSVSTPDQWQIAQNLSWNGSQGETTALVFKHIGSGVASINIDSSVVAVFGQNTGWDLGPLNVQSIITPTGLINFTVPTITAASNASAGLTTYTWTIGASTATNITAGMYFTISGFVNSGNNGRFQVQSTPTTTSLIVYNSGGVAESHAATAVLDNPYAQSGTWQCLGDLGLGNYPIVGSNFGINQNIAPAPNKIALAITVQGDVTDSAYHRIINTAPSVGNHGYEIGAIIDGTGAAPIQFQMGHFDGITGAILNNPVLATAPSGSPPVTGNTNSPALALVGQSFLGSPPVSVPDAWVLQNLANGGLSLTHTGSDPQRANFTANVTCIFGDVVCAAVTIFEEGFSGAVFTLTAASASVGGKQTLTGNYAVNFPYAGMWVTIAGFVNAGNNGTFQVFSSTAGSIVVFNSAGVLETHAATSTTESPFFPITGSLTVQSVGHGSINIGGTAYGMAETITAISAAVDLVVTTEGDQLDAGVFTTFSNSTQNHGVEVIAIYDGTGANPGYLNWGRTGLSTSHFMNLQMPDQLTGLFATGTAFNNTSVGAVEIMAGYGTGQVAEIILNAATNSVTLNNSTAAIASPLTQENPPGLFFTGQAMAGSPPASTTFTWGFIPTFTNFNGTSIFTIQEPANGGDLHLNVNNVNVSNNFMAGALQIAFSTGAAGSVYPVTSVANSVGNLATYQYTSAPGGQPRVNTYLNITGFTNPSNNGRFIIQGGVGTTSVTVYNAAAIAETHAATATVDANYYDQAGYNIYGGVTPPFPINATSFTGALGLEQLPLQPHIIFNVKGNVTDAAYFRNVTDGPTGNHFFELGVFVDGVNQQSPPNEPATLQIGYIGGALHTHLNNPVRLNGRAENITQQQPVGSPPSTSYTTTLTDNTVLVNSSTSFTVNLLVTGNIIGRIYRIKNIGTGTVTVQSQALAGSSPPVIPSIDNQPSFSIPTQMQSEEFQWDGTNWWVI